MTDPIATLSPKRQQVLTLIQNEPQSYSEIADDLGVGKSTARDHINYIQNNGVPIDYRKRNGKKVWYYRPDQNEHPINPDVPDHDLQSKSAITKDAKEAVHELIQYLNEDLTGRAPPSPDDGLVVRNGNQDMVVHRSDDHIGAKYTDEYDNNTFDAETGIERVREVCARALEIKRQKEAVGVTFDTFHLVMGGDHVHGTGIHDNQPWETELSVPKQLEVALDIYIEFIDEAVDEFPTVQIVCQRGNHGELRGDGMSPDDNVDDAFFMMLDKRIRDRGYDNVKMIRSAGSYFTNFRMRVDEQADIEKADALDMEVGELPPALQSGHRAHLRHGQNSLKHIGTSSGEKRWYNWLDKHAFDVAYRGHYHQWRIEPISSRPVVMSGAIVPPSDFEESLAEWDEPAATVHGVSDDEPLTWMERINFA